MKIVMVSSEMAPFAKTGGLADVLGTLPGALARHGHDVSVFIPLYRCVDSSSAEFLLQEGVALGPRHAAFSIFRLARHDGVTVYGIRKEEFFDRDGLYGTNEREFEDNAERFIFFSKAVVQSILSLRLEPDIVHAHDWQTALVPLYLKIYHEHQALPRIATAFTIHNMAYQGMFDAWHFSDTNLPGFFFSYDGLEFYGRLNLMKAGILYSDAVTTVSRRYAEEIQTPEFGHGLDGLLRSRHAAVHGILNGVDYSIWDPETDPHLPVNFNAEHPDGKASCKLGLLKALGMDGPAAAPLIGMVTRFAHQKGLDLMLPVIPEIMKRGVRLAILGNGEPGYEHAMWALVESYPGQVGLRMGFDDPLAHQIYAGSDFLLMPSLYEPCGLSQLYAMRYGTIPIVRTTGGLDDTIHAWDAHTLTGTGFKFGPAESDALLTAVDGALRAFGNARHLSALRQNAMIADFSWEKSAVEYETLYKNILPHA